MKIALIAVYVLTVSCGNPFDKSKSSKDEKLSYDFTVNGCKTGKQEFASKEDYCYGLMDDDLNNGCAESVRLRTFDRECN